MMGKGGADKTVFGRFVGWAIAYAIFLGLAGLGAFIAYQAADVLMSWRQVQSWQAVTARLEELKLLNIPSQEPGTYAVEVVARYRYQFNGKTYTGKRVGAFEGSREVDAWHETTYERLRNATRRSGGGNAAAVAAWVDPVHPEHAVLDRTLRWVVPLVLFPLAVLILGAAALMGYGMRMHARRGREVPAPNVERQPDDPDWSDVDAWRNGVVRSSALGSVALSWLFVFMAGMMAWGIAVGGYHHGRFSLPGAAGLLAFGALASWLMFSAVRKTLRYFKHGATYLHLEPFPARLGRELRATVNLPDPPGNEEIKVSLSCVRMRTSDDGPSSHDALWESIARVRPQMALRGSTVNFDFPLPNHLPASVWRSSGKKTQSDVDWIVRIESAGTHHLFNIPVFREGRGFSSPANSGANTLPSTGGMSELVSVLKAAREKKAGRGGQTVSTPTLPKPEADRALAAPYFERSGDALNLDTRRLPYSAWRRWSGLLLLAIGLGSFMFPSLWWSSTRWHGNLFEMALTAGTGLLALIPALIGLICAFVGIKWLSRRIRTSANPEQLTVIDKNLIWSRTTRFTTSRVAGVHVKRVGSTADMRGIYSYYDVMARLDNGKEVVLAWYVRDADMAEAIAATVQDACGHHPGNVIAETESRIEVSRRPGIALALACLLAALAPFAYDLLLQPEKWDGYNDDTERLAHLARLTVAPGHFHQWLRKDDAIHFPPRWLVRHWTTAARNRLATCRKAPDDAMVRMVPVTAGPVTINGAIGAAEWRNALMLQLQPDSSGSVVQVQSDGEHLYFAADVPGDTTPKGFDQFRISFHMGLAPEMSSERVHVDGNGFITVIRTFRAADANRYYSDWIGYERATAATAVAGHRRYELAIDMREAGIVPGAPFTIWAEIEGDPRRYPDGKFKARTSLGTSGDFRQPTWLLIPGEAG